MPCCSIYCCKSKSRTSNVHKDGISFHLFPKEPATRIQWIKAFNNHVTWVPKRTSTVCSRHFETTCFVLLANKRILKQDAIPNLQLSEAADSNVTYSCGESNHTSAVIVRDYNFTQIVVFHGYKFERYQVITSDGYILTIFRVLPKNPCPDGYKKVIVLCHGLYLSGDDWILAGPGRAHAYLFVDLCYDVWVLNMRGNLYSRAHTSLDPDKDPTFWKFDWTHMALYDVPASIDFILAKTGNTQVVYVSHSQGGTVLLYLCAKKPEYNSKILVGFGLSMTAILDHARFIVLRVQEVLSPLLTLATRQGLYSEFLPRDSLAQPAAKGLCGALPASYVPCSLFYYALLGYDKGQLCEDVLTILTGHIPSGTSFMNFDRWSQVMKLGFRERDLGVADNLKEYNQTEPPLIDVSGVSMKWYFISGENDYVGDPRDVASLCNLMPDATLCVPSDTSIGHLDYIYGKSVPMYASMITGYDATGTLQCP